MRFIATLANESHFVAIDTYCHKSAHIATIFFVAIDPNPCSACAIKVRPNLCYASYFSLKLMFAKMSLFYKAILVSNLDRNTRILIVTIFVYYYSIRSFLLCILGLSEVKRFKV